MILAVFVNGKIQQASGWPAAVGHFSGRNEDSMKYLALLFLIVSTYLPFDSEQIAFEDDEETISLARYLDD